STSPACRRTTAESISPAEAAPKKAEMHPEKYWPSRVAFWVCPRLRPMLAAVLCAPGLCPSCMSRGTQCLRFAGETSNQDDHKRAQRQRYQVKMVGYQKYTHGCHQQCGRCPGGTIDGGRLVPPEFPASSRI